MSNFDSPLKKSDLDIYKSIQLETQRQAYTLELIASENFVSEAVMEAMGSVMTNKYAEGYPGKRYYGGCHNVDIAENLARDRAKELFGCEHVNVQPHSGSQANMAVYFTLLEPGDTFMGLSLSHGGHLTHGHPISFSGIFYKVEHYTVNQQTEQINYDDLLKQAKEVKPKLIMAGASAYPRYLDFKKFREICDEVGALFVVDIAHIAGLIAAGEHPSPIPFADVVTTTTHKTLRGPRGGMIMSKEQFAKGIDKVTFPGIQGGPLMHVIAAKAVCFKEALSDEFKNYQKQIRKNAQALAQALENNGFRLVAGGTDTHLILIDMSQKWMSVKKAEKALEKAGITTNKNTIPFDTKKPFVTSGIRIGTPAITTRGMKESDMKAIADFMSKAIDNYKEDEKLDLIKKDVK